MIEVRVLPGKKKKGPENNLGSCIWQEKNSSKMQKFSKSKSKVY
jgi:hypothetical protein